MGRKLFLIASLILSSITLAGSPKQVDVAVERSYVPSGFDDNDNVQITDVGVFPDGCYHIGPSTVQIDTIHRIVFVKQSAFHSESFCMMVNVPYSKTVDVGKLQPGVYRIQDQLSGRELSLLSIARSSGKGPDDHAYAPVKDAFVVTENNVPYLSLDLDFTDRCTRLQEVRISYENDVIVVQPIVENEGRPHNCGHERFIYRYRAPLKPDLKGVWLLHVRSKDGRALNKLVDFGPELDRP